LSVFEITVQAALGFVSQSANDFIIYAASKKISLSADSDQMALPSGHPQAFREKGLTQTLCLALICADFFMIFFSLIQLFLPFCISIQFYTVSIL